MQTQDLQNNFFFFFTNKSELQLPVTSSALTGRCSPVCSPLQRWHSVLIFLYLCVVDPSWPRPENGLLLTAARGKRHVSPDTVGYGRFAGCSSSLAAGVLMWESYVDVVFFIFIFTTDTITWKKATQRSQVFIPNTFETLCVDRGGSEFIWAHLIILWCFTNDAFDSTLTAGSNRSSTDTLWECLSPSITKALLLLLCFILCFWSCTHWSTCALVQAYSRPD